jgi:hypothetical protein
VKKKTTMLRNKEHYMFVLSTRLDTWAIKTGLRLGESFNITRWTSISFKIGSIEQMSMGINRATTQQMLHYWCISKCRYVHASPGEPSAQWRIQLVNRAWADHMRVCLEACRRGCYKNSSSMRRRRSLSRCLGWKDIENTFYLNDSPNNFWICF